MGANVSLLYRLLFVYMYALIISLKEIYVYYNYIIYALVKMSKGPINYGWTFEG